MRRWVTTSAVWTMVTVARGPHAVARSPATVVDPVGFIVIQPDADAHAVVVSVSATSYGAAGRQDREQPDHESDR